MKILMLDQNEVELLVDAIRSQARLGHLNDEQSRQATKLMVKIMSKEEK